MQFNSFDLVVDFLIKNTFIERNKKKYIHRAKQKKYIHRAKQKKIHSSSETKKNTFIERNKKNTFIDETKIEKKRARPHAHGLRGRNFWKNHDFAPMQLNSFD